MDNSHIKTYLMCLLDFVYYGEQRGKPFMRYRHYGYSEDTKLMVLLHTLGGKVITSVSKDKKYYEWMLSGEELDKKINHISKLKQYSYVAKDDYNLWLAKHFQVSYIPINDEVKVYLKRTETPFVTEAPPKEAPVDKEVPTTEVPKKKKYSMFG